MHWRARKLLLTTTALVPFGLSAALANPLGGQVVGGSATIQGQGTPSVVINQSSSRAIINWNTFNIGTGEKTQFVQPSSSSVTLNRVTGGLGPSQIYGSLKANGQVFVVNPDGILIGAGATIDTAGFLATTHDIANADFMAGRYNFTVPGNPTASVVNQGTITAQSGGFAALVAPGVRNSGTITARLGRVALASGNGFSLDFYGDRLITLGVSDTMATDVKDVATGQSLASLVGNTGKLKANGGTVELTAVGARRVVDSVINTSGVVEAHSIGTHNGRIVLGGPTADTKAAGAPVQSVKVAGKLSVSGKRKNTTGGKIVVIGEDIVLTAANLDASGASGGGTVLIGGDTGGGHPSQLAMALPQARPESASVPTATTVSIDSTSLIDASARAAGDGGKVVVWSNVATSFAGGIAARGGAKSGNGGFVEVSGGTLQIAGAAVDTRAPKGNAGLWLLDPFDLTIDASAAAVIASNLSTSNLTVETSASSYAGPGVPSAGSGDILVEANIAWNTDTTLTLSAYRNVTIVPFAIISNTAGGNLVLRADNSSTGVGTVSSWGLPPPPCCLMDPGVDFSQSTGTVTILYNPQSGYAFPSNYATVVATNPAIPNQLTAYMLVNSINDLQNINQNLSGTYALGRDIDATQTSGWNGGRGFIPIGYSSAVSSNSIIPAYQALTGINATPSQFTGTLDGMNHTITNISITDTSAFNVGLFSWVGSSGVVKNVGLTRGNVTGGSQQNYGPLAAWNFGTISNAYSSATLTVGDNAGSVGGLVGWNWTGLIINSHATGNVSAGNGANGIGGLVGFSGYYYGNNSAVRASYATGDVSAGSNTSNIGGLIGDNDSAAIQNSYATGRVTAGAAASAVGGLVGLSNGFWGGNLVDSSFATGDVAAGASSTYVGGLLGINLWTATLTNSYATGNVSGGTAVGGLVGLNGYTNLDTHVVSTITSSYSTGRPNGTTYVGGLVGFQNSSTINDSYWDTDTSGTTTGIGGSSGGSYAILGLETTGLQRLLQPGFSPSVWALNSGVNSGYPYLINNAPPSSALPASSPPTSASNSGATGTASVNSVLPPTTANQQYINNFEPTDWNIAGPTTPAVYNTNSAESPNSLPSTALGPSPHNEPVLAPVSQSHQDTTPTSNMQTVITTQTGTLSFEAISQLNTNSNIYGALNATAKDGKTTIENETCVAVVYTMIARAAGDTSATVDRFWDNTLGAVRNGFSGAITFSYNGALESGDFKTVNSSVPRFIPTSGPSPAINSLGSGPVMIGGSISYSGGTEVHWMLGVAVDGTKVIANDPWTGTKVKIETQGPNAGKVIEIMDPKSGLFYSFSSLQSGTLPIGVKTDFSSLPTDTKGNPSYTALRSFDASGANGGYVSVSIN